MPNNAAATNKGSSSCHPHLDSGLKRRPTTQSILDQISDASYSDVVIMERNYKAESDTETEDEIDHICKHSIEKMTDFEELKFNFKNYMNQANEKYKQVVRERDDMARKLDITKDKAKKLVAAFKRLDKKKLDKK